MTREYQVIDLALRLRTDAPFPMQIVLDGATNRKAPDQKHGVWATLVLGSLKDISSHCLSIASEQLESIRRR